MGSSGDGSSSSSTCVYSDLPRQVLLMLPQTTSHSTNSIVTSIAPLVEHFERQLSTQLSKKKRREYLKDFLKAAATGGENNGNGGGGQSGKGTRSVLDIRKRMTVRFPPPNLTPTLLFPLLEPLAPISLTLTLNPT